MLYCWRAFKIKSVLFPTDSGFRLINSCLVVLLWFFWNLYLKDIISFLDCFWLHGCTVCNLSLVLERLFHLLLLTFSLFPIVLHFRISILSADSLRLKSKLSFGKKQFWPFYKITKFEVWKAQNTSIFCLSFPRLKIPVFTGGW